LPISGPSGAGARLGTGGATEVATRDSWGSASVRTGPLNRPIVADPGRPGKRLGRQARARSSADCSDCA
jgi:hypothetical protein